jgi:hypothetical protein
MVMASAFISGMALIVLIVVLTLIIRGNRQDQVLETWISREFSRLHESMDLLRNQVLVLQQQISATGIAQAQPPSNALPPPGGRQTMYEQYMPEAGRGESAARPKLSTPRANVSAPPANRGFVPSTPRERALPAEVKHVMRLINEQLAQGEPFHMEELLNRAVPRMNVVKLSQRATDSWSTAVLLDAGDAYFALADNTQAFLFPCEERFNAACDPSALFDGARTDVRIHNFQKPGILAKTSDGAWQLIERGRVQMR